MQQSARSDRHPLRHVWRTCRADAIFIGRDSIAARDHPWRRSSCEPQLSTAAATATENTSSTAAPVTSAASSTARCGRGADGIDGDGRDHRVSRKH
jgi:hypothetical protein